jgi:hypothetical protein
MPYSCCVDCGGDAGPRGRIPLANAVSPVCPCQAVPGRLEEWQLAREHDPSPVSGARVVLLICSCEVPALQRDDRPQPERQHVHG